jgi:hypothetical protein
MIGVAIDALVLMFLLQTIIKEDVEFGPMLLLAIAISFGALFVTLALVPLLGDVGIVVSAVVVALLLGVIVSALYGAEIKRSFLVGVAFVVVHIAVSFGFQMIFHP